MFFADIDSDTDADDVSEAELDVERVSRGDFEPDVHAELECDGDCDGDEDVELDPDPELVCLAVCEFVTVILLVLQDDLDAVLDSVDVCDVVIDCFEDADTHIDDVRVAKTDAVTWVDCDEELVPDEDDVVEIVTDGDIEFAAETLDNELIDGEDEAEVEGEEVLEILECVDIE